MTVPLAEHAPSVSGPDSRVWKTYDAGQDVNDARVLQLRTLRGQSNCKMRRFAARMPRGVWFQRSFDSGRKKRFHFQCGSNPSGLLVIRGTRWVGLWLRERAAAWERCDFTAVRMR